VIAALAVVCAGGVWGYNYWKEGTPEYSLQQLERAIAQHDTTTAALYFNEDAIWSNVWPRYETLLNQSDNFNLLGSSILDAEQSSIQSAFQTGIYDVITGSATSTGLASILYAAQNQAFTVNGDTALMTVSYETAPGATPINIPLVFQRQPNRSWTITDIQGLEKIMFASAMANSSGSQSGSPAGTQASNFQAAESELQSDLASDAASDLVLPVTVLPTSEDPAAAKYEPKYPSSVDVSDAAGFANQIAAYGAAHNVWIAPQGWTGEGSVSTDGNLGVTLYPPGGSADSGQRVSYYEIPGCGGCMLDSAAPYFASAMQQYNLEDNTDGSEPIPVPQGLTVTPISSTLVTYTLPDEGNLYEGTLSVSGVVYYNPDNQNVPFAEAEFFLPTSDAPLANFLSQTFISQEGLQ